MKIYTSYFAVANKLPPDMIKISIAGKTPDGWDGLKYSLLAPRWTFFKVWQQTKDNDYYIKCYNELVLSKLNPQSVLKELKMAYLSMQNRNNEEISYTSDSDLCLMCYEKPDSFCHRHLVADWLNAAGIECEEYIIRKD